MRNHVTLSESISDHHSPLYTALQIPSSFPTTTNCLTDTYVTQAANHDSRGSGFGVRTRLTAATRQGYVVAT